MARDLTDTRGAPECSAAEIQTTSTLPTRPGPAPGVWPATRQGLGLRAFLPSVHAPRHTGGLTPLS